MTTSEERQKRAEERAAHLRYRAQIAQEMRDSEKSIAHIAKVLGISQNTVRQILEPRN